MAAEAMGLADHLLAEFQGSQAPMVQRMERGIPSMPAKARRWVSEMQEIEATYASLGMTPHIFRGVSQMYELIGSTSLGDETPEARDRERTLQETIQLLAQHLVSEDE